MRNYPLKLLCTIQQQNSAFEKSFPKWKCWRFSDSSADVEIGAVLPLSILLIQELICVEMRELIVQPAHQAQLKENHPSGSMKITTREIIVRVRGLSSLKHNNTVLVSIFHTLLVALQETALTFLEGSFEAGPLSSFQQKLAATDWKPTFRKLVFQCHLCSLVIQDFY